MPAKPERNHRQLPWLLRLVRARWRLFLSGGIGLLILALLMLVP